MFDLMFDSGESLMYSKWLQQNSHQELLINYDFFQTEMWIADLALNYASYLPTWHLFGTLNYPPRWRLKTAKHLPKENPFIP